MVSNAQVSFRCFAANLHYIFIIFSSIKTYMQTVKDAPVLSFTQKLRRLAEPAIQGTMEDHNDEAAEFRATEKSEEVAQIRAEFAARLEKALDMQGYPRKNYGRNVQLAKDLGISQPHAYKVLNGAIPPAVTLKRLCIVAHCSADYLLGLSENPSGESVDERHGHDDAIVRWHWRPEGDVRTESDLFVPKSIKVSGVMKAFWAERRERMVEDQRELVIYDPANKTLTDNDEFLMTINGTEQIRLVHMSKGHAILLFNNNTLPLTVPLDTMKTDGVDEIVILGRVYFRTIVPHRRSK